MAIGAAATIPGTLVNLAAGGGDLPRCLYYHIWNPWRGRNRRTNQRRMDHPSGQHEPQRQNPYGGAVRVLLSASAL